MRGLAVLRASVLVGLVVAGMPSVVAAASASPGFVTPWERLPHLPPGLRSDLAPCEHEPLPAALRKVLPQEFRAAGGVEVFGLIRHDLDGDGRPDYLIGSPEAYSGGTMYAVVQTPPQPAGRWRFLGWIQGGFHIASREGVPAGRHVGIETWSRHGGSIFHSFHEYRGGRYVDREQIEWPREFDPPRVPFDVACR